MMVSHLAMGMAFKNFIPLQGAQALKRHDAIYVDIGFAPAVRDRLGLTVPTCRAIVGGQPL